MIGTAWGSGNGISTFNLPDLRGLFLRGVDNNAGKDPDSDYRLTLHPGGNTGDNVGSYQLDQIQSHTHSIQAYNGGSGSNAINSQASVSSSIYFGSTNSFGGNETRPKNVYVLYIIKY